MACACAGWPERAHDSADVIGMAVRQDDDINLSGRSSGRSERLDQPGGDSVEILPCTRVDESDPPVRANDEDIARESQLSPLIAHHSERLFDSRRIRIRCNVESRRSREDPCAAELPRSGPSHAHHEASLSALLVQSANTHEVA